MDYFESQTIFRFIWVMHFIARRIALGNHGKKGNAKMGLSVLTLEFLQWLGIIIWKPFYVHNSSPGDCHKCQLKCLQCQEAFGSMLRINELLPLIPMASMEHFALIPSPEK